MMETTTTHSNYSNYINTGHKKNADIHPASSLKAIHDKYIYRYHYE